MWGAKLDEIAKGTAKGVLKHSTTGAAAEFKNILTAAINWTYVVTQAYAPNDVILIVRNCSWYKFKKWYKW
ncbi:hypothetical protein NW070_06165 [Mycoplasmopsis cynos]|nr:hypothetical protein [Mycoplasmopsis cynos]UWV77262.1 hypothetical protein NW070_06165 [Mycoplasmopsis cynos]WAM04580.1 hypothetical protein ONA01_06360 [Mycoplasmopsis cynos]